MAFMTLTGTGTMLTKNIRLGDPDDPITQQISALNALKSKITPEQQKDREYLKWLGAMYYDDQRGPILPSANVIASLRGAATATRRGKAITTGLFFLAPDAPLEYDGPRDLKELWNGGTGPYVSRLMARVNRAPVPNTRPAYPAGWQATYEFELDEDVMGIDEFRTIATAAGRRIHVGDYRQVYGAYSVEIAE